MSRRGLVTALVLVVLVVPLAVLGAKGMRSHVRGDAGPSGVEEVDGDSGRAGSEELDDDDAMTAERLEALAKAKANGTFGGKATTTSPVTGWVGSRLLNRRRTIGSRRSPPTRPHRTSSSSRRDTGRTRPAARNNVRSRSSP
jgi:hypothetical protein